MGSTTSGGAVTEESAKDKKDSGKKKATSKTASKKTRSRTTTVKKKAATGKKAAASKKPPGRKATAKKKAPGKKAPARKKSAKKPDKHADVAPAAGTAPGPVGATAVATAEGDSKSLSWMAAQAASALKAVRENQNERAQALLAKAEITPATPVKPGKKAGTRTEPDLSATGKAHKTKPPVKGKTAGAAQPGKAESRRNKQPVITPEPVRAGTGKDTTTDTMPEPVKAATIQAVNEPSTDMAAEPAAPQAPAANKPEATQAVAAALPEVSGDSGDQQADTSPADVIAATSTATGNRRSLRPFLITGFIVLIGVLGARAWFSDDDTADIAVIQEGAEAEQVTAVTARPQITVVAAEPAEQPATDDALQTESLSPATATAGPEPADDTRQALQTIEPVPPETPTPQPKVVTQSPAAAPQAASRPAPQPGYYAPAYGYYPQQPARQQPYYRPAY